MRVPMTVGGAEALRSELDRLKKEVRPSIIKSIAEAREHGDLRENAEYHAAKEQQGFTEARIAEIESKLAEAQIIDVTKIAASGRVVFGSTVTVVNIETDEEQVFRIVGEDEADVKSRSISINSPIARALIGKESGDVALVKTPSGDVEFEIERIELI